jgi:hypothetical protein
MKYNLTFWQRVGLIPTWIMWVMTSKKDRKSWHEVKKGMEPHVCKFTIRYLYKGEVWYRCEHEGCKFAESEWWNNYLSKQR